MHFPPITEASVENRKHTPGSQCRKKPMASQCTAIIHAWWNSRDFFYFHKSSPLVRLSNKTGLPHTFIYGYVFLVIPCQFPWRHNFLHNAVEKEQSLTTPSLAIPENRRSLLFIARFSNVESLPHARGRKPKFPMYDFVFYFSI